MTEKLLVTIEEAAEVLSLSVRTVRYMIERGELVPVRVGRAVRLATSTLRAYVEMRTADAANASAVQMEPSVGRSTRLRAG